MSQITTHVLDTALGKPAKGITIALERPNGLDLWEEIARGVTNADGRISNLLPAEKALEPGTYRMVFHTGEYQEKLGNKGFYPVVPIVFETFDSSHYHIPLLLNPFGYSTYRGS